MGVLYDYFAAPSDAVAAELIDAPAGPGGPEPPNLELRKALRRGDRAAISRAVRPRLRESDAGILVVGTKGVDPDVHIVALEALLTSDTQQQVRNRPRCGLRLADPDSGEMMVVTLTDELSAALARATSDELDALAVPWLRTEGFMYSDAEPEMAGYFLRALGDLARRASERGERLYCWICL